MQGASDGKGAQGRLGRLKSLPREGQYLILKGLDSLSQLKGPPPPGPGKCCPFAWQPAPQNQSPQRHCESQPEACREAAFQEPQNLHETLDRSSSRRFCRISAAARWRRARRRWFPGPPGSLEARKLKDLEASGLLLAWAFRFFSRIWDFLSSEIRVPFDTNMSRGLSLRRHWSLESHDAQSKGRAKDQRPSRPATEFLRGCERVSRPEPYVLARGF